MIVALLTALSATILLSLITCSALLMPFAASADTSDSLVGKVFGIAVVASIEWLLLHKLAFCAWGYVAGLWAGVL